MSDRMPNSKQLAFGGWACLRSGVWGAVLDVFLFHLSVGAAVFSGVFAMYPPGERSKHSLGNFGLCSRTVKTEGGHVRQDAE